MNKTVFAGLGERETSLSDIQRYLAAVAPATLSMSYNDIMDTVVITIVDQNWSVRHAIPMGDIVKMSESDYVLHHLVDMRKELDDCITKNRAKEYASLGGNADIKKKGGFK